jgi:hypothetical protein
VIVLFLWLFVWLFLWLFLLFLWLFLVKHDGGVLCRVLLYYAHFFYIFSESTISCIKAPSKLQWVKTT